MSASLLLAINKCINLSQKTWGYDFYQFWIIGHYFEQVEKANIYHTNIQRKIEKFYHDNKFLDKSQKIIISAKYREIKHIEIFSTPLLYFFFDIISTGDYDYDIMIFQMISLSLYLLGIIICCYICHCSFKWYLFYLTLFTYNFIPLHSDIWMGNVNRFQFGLLMISIFIFQKQNSKTIYFLNGILLGFIILFKPNVVFIYFSLMLVWVISRQFRKIFIVNLGIGLITTIIFFLTNLYYNNFYIWLDWLVAISKLPDNIITLDQGNLSLLVLIKEFMPLNTNGFIIIFVSFMLLIYFFKRLMQPELTLNFKKSILLTSNKYHNERNIEISDFIYGALSMFILSKLVWHHYYILLIPFFIYTVNKATFSYKILFLLFLSYFITIKPIYLFYNSVDFYKYSLIMNMFLIFSVFFLLSEILENNKLIKKQK